MRYTLVFILSLVLVPKTYADPATGGVQLITPMIQESSLMGKTLKVQQNGETVPSGQGIVTTTQAEFLGHSGTLIEASVEAIPMASPAAEAIHSRDLIGGTSGGFNGAAPSPASPTTAGSPAPAGTVLGSTDLYIEGVRIWTGNLNYANGTLTYSGGVPPTQIPFTVFVYPVGPLLLEVDAGVEFEGSLDASIALGPSYPLTDSTLDAKLAASIGAGGFIEGYANLWLIRGGVGGAVDLIDGTTGVAAHIYMNGRAPAGSGFGYVHLLSGDIYAFVDTKFFFGRWNRIWKKDFYKWAGWCYSFGEQACGVQ